MLLIAPRITEIKLLLDKHLNNMYSIYIHIPMPKPLSHIRNENKTKLFMPHANSKSPVNWHSMIGAFVVRFLDIV